MNGHAHLKHHDQRAALETMQKVKTIVQLNRDVLTIRHVSIPCHTYDQLL